MDGLDAFREAVEKSDFAEAVGMAQSAKDRAALGQWLIAWTESDTDNEQLVYVRFSDGIGALGLAAHAQSSVAKGFDEVEGTD